MYYLKDFSGAFIGWNYYDWKIKQQIPYLDTESSLLVEDKDKITEFSDEKTIKNLQKRYKKMYGSEGFFTYEQWKRVVDFYCGPARLCLSCKDKKFIIPDHIHSASLGGSNYIVNIQPICVNCNSAKRSDDTDFRPDKGLFCEIIAFL